MNLKQRKPRISTLGQSEHDGQSYAKRERVRKCVGGACLTQANRYSVKGHEQPRPCSQSSILWSKPQPTWEADGRIRKERSRRWTSTGVGLPRHNPCRLVHLLKDCQCCHGHKDLSDAMAIKMIRSRQSYLGGYT